MGLFDSSSHVPRRASVLLAKSSITGAANREMEALVERLQGAADVGHATYAFSEQGRRAQAYWHTKLLAFSTSPEPL